MATENKTGTVLRGYELMKLLGEGGFGAVYRAHQTAIKRDVALKIILPEYANQPEFIRSFESEAQLIARLEHLHVVPLYDFWRDPDGAYLVMRLMPGGSLRDLIEDGPIALPLAARIIDQIASALHTAHRQGIVHRDIKPDNILLDGEQNAFLTDFGISIDLNREPDEDEDDFDDTLTGSPHYISPEQAQAQQISGRSDIYSLGIVLFEMVTGQAPFAGNTTMMELILKQINEPLPPIETLNPDIPIEVDMVVQRATDKDPEARYANTLEFAKAFRQAVPELAQAITEEDEALTEDIITVQLITPSIENPYKGLRPFEQSDADDFFGRNTLIARLLESVANNRFMAVIGPSGSGKSSVVKAGLIPRLRGGAIAGSKNWYIAEMVPSNDPFREVASALLSVATARHPNLENQLKVDDRGLLVAVNNILPDGDTQLLLLIDQFEETFTQVADESVRSAFLGSLLVAATSSDSRLRVIVTLRADFYDRPLLYPGFGELIRKHGEVVLPLSAEELEETIVAPAQRVGLHVESSLIAAITTEIQDQPGALPLLQYALTEVFERRSGTTLTYEAYQASGGVLGALARRAEEIYLQLNQVQQNAARQIFLRLVTLGEGTEDTRRRIEQGDLLSLGDNETAIEDVLSLYSRYRLLTFDNDPVTRNPTVEVAHEAILREWARLREWLDDNRDELRVQQRLAASAGNWISGQRETSYLVSGLQLHQYEQLLASDIISLTDDESAYIKASIEERDRQEALEAERIANEKRLEKRARRILQTAVGIFAALTFIAGLLALFAFTQRTEAISARDEAETNFERAESESIQRATAEAEAVIERNLALQENARVLSVISETELNNDPVASLNLALRAIADGDTSALNYVPEAERALTAAFNQSQERVYIEPFDGETIGNAATNGDQVLFIGSGLAISDVGLQTIAPLEELTTTGLVNVSFVEWSIDGRFLSVRDNILTVWENEQPVTSLETSVEIDTAIWSPDGEVIAVASGDEAIIWFPATNERLVIENPDASETGLSQFFRAIAWSTDGQFVVFSNGIRLVVWRADTESVAYDIVAEREDTPTDAIIHQHTASIEGVLFIDETRFMSWANDGTHYLWNAEDGTLLQVLTNGDTAVNGVVISPNTERMLVYQNNGENALWTINADGIVPLGELEGYEDTVVQAAWQNSDILAISSTDGVIVVWDIVANARITTLHGHTQRVDVLHWLNDRYLLSVSQDGSARQWEIFGENGLPVGNGLDYQAQVAERGSVEAFWADDTTVVIAGQDGLAHRIDLETQEVVTLPDDSRIRWFLIWSDDGSLVLRYDNTRDQLLQLWDFESQTMRFEIANFNADRAFLTPIGVFTITSSGDLIWYDFDGNTLGQLDGHTTSINDIIYHAATQQIATAGDDQIINIYDASGNTPLSAPLSPTLTIDTGGRIPVRLTWNASGTNLASVGFNGDVLLWDIETNTQVFFATTGDRDFPGRTSLVYSPDESLIAGAIDDEVIIFNLNGEVVFRYSEGNAVQSVEWVPHDSRLRLMAAGNTLITGVGFVAIWDIDVATGDGVLIWRNEGSGNVTVAAPNSTGSQILTSDTGGRVSVFRVWPSVPTLIETATACCQTRPLSDTQLAQFNIRD